VDQKLITPKNIAISFIITVLSVLIIFFNKSTIEHKNAKISHLERELKAYELKVSQLELLNKEKDVKIIEIIKKDGTKKTITKINEKTNKAKINTSELNSREEKASIKNKDIKTTKITNPKKLNIGIGLDSNLKYYGNINYNFNDPFSLGGHIKNDGTIGIHLGFSF
jgi:vacuolar-type H+-ATPase subunit I/STV1